MIFNELYIRTEQDLADAVNTLGFVPFFRNSIPGFSVSEHIAPAAWFPDEGEGIWEWKGPVIRKTGCAYGKFIGKKAVFISKEWFPDFANVRRGGLDFDELYDFGMAQYQDKVLYKLLEQHAPVTSSELKFLGGYGKEGKKGFDPLIARLQMQCYALISDFVYQRDKYGLPYGWGVAQYSTPELFFGEEFADDAYARTPEESYARVLAHLHSILPHADEKQLKKLLK